MALLENGVLSKAFCAEGNIVAEAVYIKDEGFTIMAHYGDKVAIEYEKLDAKRANRIMTRLNKFQQS